MDIEGSEVDVMPDLLFTGELQYGNTLMLEWHEWMEILAERQTAQQLLKSIMKTVSNYSQPMKDQGGKFYLNLIKLEDETYYTSQLDLPYYSL